MSSSNVSLAELAFLFQEELELCGVKAGTQVALVTDMNTPQDYILAAFAAGDKIGAGIYEVRISTPFNPNMIASQQNESGNRLDTLPGAMKGIAEAELVIAFHVALGAKWLQDGRKRGQRFLLIIDGPDELKRLMSPPGLKEAAKYAQDLTNRTKEMHVTSPHGTDFRARLGELDTVCQWGYADEPGHVDTWGGAHFSTWANPGSSEGTVVLVPGDCWIFPYARYFESRVDLTIEAGHITNIEGTGTDQRLMTQFFKEHQTSPDDRTPYAVSHLGWGLNPNSYVDQMVMHPHDLTKLASHTRAWPGVFLFSTGPDDQGGGKNHTPAHLDLPMFDCSVAYDGKTIIKDGEIVDKKMIVKQTFPKRISA